jgi:NAD(P)-dependent dehydrogenase (short-subunit alcohol dehydrogenase family)
VDLTSQPPISIIGEPRHLRSRGNRLGRFDDPLAGIARLLVIMDNTLLGRLGEPTDIAGVVKALVSPDMSFVTAQIIEVSGGLFLK